MMFRSRFRKKRDVRNTTYKKVGNSEISIGRFTYGDELVNVRQWGEGAKLFIGSFCSLASSIDIFLGGNHRHDWATTFPFGHIYTADLGKHNIVGQPYSNGDVWIGHDVWIGSSVTIMSGVTIGDGAVIAANTHVVKDVLPYEVVGGNPARSIKFRFSEDIVRLLLILKWWELPLEVIQKIAPALSEVPSYESLQQLILETRGLHK